MSLFDDFSVNAKACAGKVSRKADAAAKISRLKISENRLQRSISKSLKLLGAKVYKAYSASESDLQIKDDVLAISDMYQQLKVIRKQINDVKNNEFTTFDEKNTENKG